MLQVRVHIVSTQPGAPAPIEVDGFVPDVASPLAVTPVATWSPSWTVHEDRWQITHRATGLNLGGREFDTREAAMAVLVRCEPASVWDVHFLPEAEREVIGINEGAMSGWNMDGSTKFVDRVITVANTPAAREWEGWGTALKPAFEPIVLARKPLSESTVAANVLRWRTGALNIDACRVAASDKTPAPVGQYGGSSIGPNGHSSIRDGAADGLGRWPANVVHDGSDEVLAAFPRTASGTGAVKKATAAGHQNNAYGKESRPAGTPNIEYGDEGSAARFFYSAKASKADRAGSKHPTVKPVSLMQWLARLVTPPGGTVLDPFAGSGTTGAACALEGFNVILVEREAEYVRDIVARFADFC